MRERSYTDILSFLSFSLDLWNGNCNEVLVSFQVTVFPRMSAYFKFKLKGWALNQAGEALITFSFERVEFGLVIPIHLPRTKIK